MHRLIVAASAACALAACSAGPHNLTQAEQQTAELGGIKFTQALGQDFLGCSGIDSEPDGYVTCSSKNRETAAVSQIVCSYQSGAAGCKMK
jgi:hypothetical protein